MKLNGVFCCLLWCAGSGLAQVPVVADGGVANAATMERGAGVAPGATVAIFGNGLAAGLARLDSVPLSNTIADVSVTFNGVRAPLQFVSDNMISAQVPWNVLPDPAVAGTAAVVVTRAGVASPTTTVPITPFSPAIHRLHTWTSQAMAFNSDSTLTAPAGAFDGLQSHPANVGDAVLIYANGLGPVTPAAANGDSARDTARTTVTTPTVLIQGIPAAVQFSGLSPKIPGMNLVVVTVPAGVTSSDAAPVQIQIGGVATTIQPTIAVQGQ